MTTLKWSVICSGTASTATSCKIPCRPLNLPLPDTRSREKWKNSAGKRRRSEIQKADGADGGDQFALLNKRAGSFHRVFKAGMPNLPHKLMKLGCSTFAFAVHYLPFH